MSGSEMQIEALKKEIVALHAENLAMQFLSAADRPVIFLRRSEQMRLMFVGKDKPKHEI
jgi:uracil-DNA glycosylase